MTDANKVKGQSMKDLKVKITDYNVYCDATTISALRALGVDRVAYSRSSTPGREGELCMVYFLSGLTEKAHVLFPLSGNVGDVIEYCREWGESILSCYIVQPLPDANTHAASYNLTKF